MLAGYPKSCAFRLVAKNEKDRSAPSSSSNPPPYCRKLHQPQVKYRSQRPCSSSYCLQHNFMAVQGTNILLKCVRIGRNPTTVINAIAPWGKVCDLLIKELLPCVCWKEAALLHFLLFELFFLQP